MTDRMRVALLARAGQARDQLHRALEEAGVLIVAEGDPAELDPKDVAEKLPKFFLVGLEPATEKSIDRFDALFEAVPSPVNGLTLCVGSLTAGRHNDASALVRHFAPRIHFAHLRTVLLEEDDSFVEADHLAGDANLVDVGRVLVAEERRRRKAGLAHAEIAMRPDHGRVLEGDIADLPGYPWLGRLKALAELRGMLTAIEQLT